jgi:hypothetical protein
MTNLHYSTKGGKHGRIGVEEVYQHHSIQPRTKTICCKNIENDEDMEDENFAMRCMKWNG